MTKALDTSISTTMRVLKCKTDHRKLSLEISNVYIDNAQDNNLFQTIQTLRIRFSLWKKVHKMKLFSKTLVFGNFCFGVENNSELHWVCFT